MEDQQLQDRLIELYRMHHRDVYQFLLYFTGQRDDAEDLTQEVFLRVHKSQNNFAGNSSFKTWIFAIAKHVAADFYRRKKFNTIALGAWIQQVPTGGQSPEEWMEMKENWQRLDDALQKLKPHARSVVILRGLKEFSVKETAEILGCSEAKVKVDYHRALKKLQQTLMLTEEGGLHHEFAK